MPPYPAIIAVFKLYFCLQLSGQLLCNDLKSYFFCKEMVAALGRGVRHFEQCEATLTLTMQFCPLSCGYSNGVWSDELVVCSKLAGSKQLVTERRAAC